MPPLNTSILFEAGIWSGQDPHGPEEGQKNEA